MLYTTVYIMESPKSDGGRQIVGYCIEMLDLPTGGQLRVLVTHTEELGHNAVRSHLSLTGVGRLLDTA